MFLSYNYFLPNVFAVQIKFKKYIYNSYKHHIYSENADNYSKYLPYLKTFVF